MNEFWDCVWKLLLAWFVVGVPVVLFFAICEWLDHKEGKFR
jgi:hypothetical protein